MLAKRNRLAAIYTVLASCCALAFAPAANATVVVEGTLLTGDGRPTAGWVTLNPTPSRDGTFPQIGSTRAGADGKFSLSVSNPRILRKYTDNPRRSRIGDYKASGFLDDGSSGTWSFSGWLKGRGKDTRVLDVDNKATPPQIRFRADEPPSASATKSARNDPPATASPREVPVCGWSSKVVGTTVARTIVGELNNAYNDGTSARFQYGTEEEAATTVGLAVSTNGGSWKQQGSKTIRTSSRVGTTIKRRYSRILSSDFRYEKVRYTRTCTIFPEPTDVRTEIRPKQFLGGLYKRRQRGGLDRCSANVPGGRYASGDDFYRSREAAATWATGADAFGVALSTRSNFSRGITLTYRFGGRRGKMHYLCGGARGTESPMTSGRVFSGRIRG